MSNNDRIIGNLQKGVQGLERSVAEIRADIKKLLAQHNQNKGVMYAISAFVGGITSIFINILK